MNRRTFLNAVCLASVISLAGLTGCLGAPTGDNGNTNSDSGSNSNSYQQVDAEAAKELMDTEDDYVILDARTQTEYDEGHIPGAILIPHDTVATAAENALPDKDQLILVYCRSGNRSKEASQALVDLGFPNRVPSFWLGDSSSRSGLCAYGGIRIGARLPRCATRPRRPRAVTRRRQ